MCRSIITLRRPEPEVSWEECEAAARQYVRKISGYRTPSKANEEVFERAVHDIAHMTQDLLADLVVGASALIGHGRGVRPDPVPARLRGAGGFKDTYGGAEGIVVCESYLLRPKDVASDTVIVFMHPVGARRVPADGPASSPAGPPRHLLQQPLPQPTAPSIMEKVRARPRRLRARRQGAAGLRARRPRRLERRRRPVALLPGAGRAAVGHGHARPAIRPTSRPPACSPPMP